MAYRLLTVLASACCLPLAAQWVNYKESGIPRTKDGKANLSAPAPRAPNGKPDLSGVWMVQPSTNDEYRKVLGDGFEKLDVPGNETTSISKYLFNILADYRPEEEPLRPEAAKLLQEHAAGLGKDAPSTHCLPGGVPWATFIPPFKMIQAPREIVMLHEDNNPPRQIYTDGRKPPAQIDLPSWVGYSVGNWQGDTLVVDTVGFNDRGWLDGFGHPRSEDLHIVERFTRHDFGHMDIAITIDDPKMYTKSWSIKVSAVLLPDTDVLEAVCAENEKDIAHMNK
ncbi:MAG TPA: hypothetical protein VN841_02975 [Bryobacteraceae bacterium]|nr:hypothetical protein [Bryobacteraceae bacterium]